MQPKSYFIARNISRKIMREGTGLVVERCDTAWLRLKQSEHIGMLLAHAHRADLSNVELVRGIVQLYEIDQELTMRAATQMQLDLFSAGEREAEDNVRRLRDAG